MVKSNKKKYKTRYDLFFELFTMISGLIGLIVFLFSSSLVSAIISFFTSLIVCLTGYVILSIPTVKGKIGEYKVNRRLNQLLQKNGGYISNDVMIVDDYTNKSSQIDHIYFSRFGVFVIETKNYSGRIYGKDSDDRWTQIFNFGRTKNKFYNPVKQNYTHAFRLQKILGIDKSKLNSVVVFVQNNIEYIDSDYVFPLKQLRDLVSESDTPVFSDEEVVALYNKLTTYQNGVTLTNKEHIQEIKQMVKDVEENKVCPRCGGELVLRKNRDGKSFYGCKNYPNCKFTKKA